jgi:hypothetical protein
LCLMYQEGVLVFGIIITSYWHSQQQFLCLGPSNSEQVLWLWRIMDLSVQIKFSMPINAWNVPYIVN